MTTNLPPQHILQVPYIGCDPSMDDIRTLIAWCKKEAKDYALATVEANRSDEDAQDAAKEEWRGLFDAYEVSNLGRVRAGARILQPWVRGKGYLSVSIWQDGKNLEPYVHRLVAEAFCRKESADQTQVNHRNGDRTDNRAENLEWCTPKENRTHAARVLFTQEVRPVIGTEIATGKEVTFRSGVTESRMDDRRMLELAARAAGIVHEGWVADNYRRGLFLPPYVRIEALLPVWNPLTDDGDALRLAVKLKLALIFHGTQVTAAYSENGIWADEQLNDDPYAATRRAIFRAAAAIGEQMEGK